MRGIVAPTVTTFTAPDGDRDFILQLPADFDYGDEAACAAVDTLISQALSDAA